MRPARRRCRRWFRAIGAPLAVLLICTCFAAAQTANEPIIFGQREKRDVLTLYNTFASVELNYRYTHDKIDPNDQPAQTFTENRFEETFTLETQGAIVHPNLIELKLAGTFGLTQEWLDNTGQEETNYGTIIEYDVEATFLRKEEVPVTVYARRTQNTVDRTFGPTFDNTIQTEGVIVDWHNKTVPTRIEAFHSDQTQSGLDVNNTEFDLSQNSFIWHSEYRPTQRQVWNWDYTFNQIHETTTGLPSNDFITNSAALSHSIDFGYKDRSHLSSLLSYFNQSGDFPYDQLQWDERLLLAHSDTFETNYQYTFLDQTVNDIDQTTNRGQVGFTHRLYKSLITSGWVGIENINRSDGSDSLTTFAHVDWDYHKSVPLGSLAAFFAVNWSRADNSQQIQPIQVVNESHTFNDPFPIVLTRQGIDPTSIRVTDTRDITVYTPGADYVVTDFGTRVEIERVIGGRINNGQTVLLDYVIEPQGENVTTTCSFSVGGRYDIERGPLKGFSLYSRFTDQHQSIDSSDAFTFTPNSYTDTVVGAEYKIWKTTFGAEQEWYDSTLYPFNATRFFARYIDRFSQDTTAVVSATYSIIEYPDEDNQLNLLFVSGQVSHRFTRELYGFASVLYQNEQDDLRGSTIGLEEQVELNWQRRQTTVYVLFRNSDLSTDFQDTSFQIVRVGIRREF
jgi:hypothetical protein